MFEVYMKDQGKTNWNEFSWITGADDIVLLGVWNLSENNIPTILFSKNQWSVLTYTEWNVKISNPVLKKEKNT